jgi:D-proline reductase (dithiol) PrdB
MLWRIKKIKDKWKAKRYAARPILMDRYANRPDLIVNNTIPWAPAKKALYDSRVTLVTTAGVHLKAGIPFNMLDQFGDPTFREIPNDVLQERLTITHNYFDSKDAISDINLVLPIEPLLRLVRKKIIGSIAKRSFSFMGHISGGHVDALLHESAPAMVKKLIQDKVDIVFLTPASGLCNQSVGLIQRAIEDAGIATISISLNRTITLKVKPPRAIYPGFRLGHPMGRPNDIELQYSVIKDALKKLYVIKEPGTLLGIDYRLKKPTYMLDRHARSWSNGVLE